MSVIIHGIILGMVLGMMGMSAYSLSKYLGMVEDDNNCKECERYESCFAKQTYWNGRFVWLDEFMLVSFLKVRHQCRYYQKESMKWRIVYLSFSCILMTVLFWSKGISGATYILCVATAMLLMLSVVDWNTEFIPMECNIGIFLCGLMQLFADFSNWVEYAIGLIAVSGFLLLVNWVATPILRKKYEGEREIDQVVGYGDIKLMAATGLLLGWKLNFLALGLGCVIGSIIHITLMRIKGSDKQFALGPYLSLGVFITMICGEQLISWYLNVMGVVPMN